MIESKNDPDELQEISAFYIRQDFRVTEISKSLCSYNAPPLKFITADDEQSSKTSSSAKSKSKYVYKKPNLPGLPHSEEHATGYKTGYKPRRFK